MHCRRLLDKNRQFIIRELPNRPRNSKNLVITTSCTRRLLPTSEKAGRNICTACLALKVASVYGWRSVSKFNKKYLFNFNRVHSIFNKNIDSNSTIVFTFKKNIHSTSSINSCIHIQEKYSFNFNSRFFVQLQALKYLFKV